MKQALTSLPGNYSKGKMNSNIQYLIIDTMLKCKPHLSLSIISDFFQGQLLLQRKYLSWYIPSPIRYMIRVILTLTLHSESIASRILTALINSSFI